MGAQPTKPNDVSDAAWERTQQRKLEAVQEEQAVLRKLNDEKNETLRRVTIDLLDYCSACNDIPSYLMIFPSYRQRCRETRTRLLGNVVDIAKAISEEDRAIKAISKISRL